MLFRSPARHREALLARCAGRLVVTADFDKCLLIYPLPDWEPIQQKLMSLSSLNPRIRDLQRQLVGYAEDIELDAAGRVLISPALRGFAALAKNVVLVGQGAKFELWDREKWEQALERGPFGVEYVANRQLGLLAGRFARGTRDEVERMFAEFGLNFDEAERDG